ncbi:hypothetical protein BC739_007434 [Kutzneria viridogrisea]|uniref:Uncharacterized protein n=1 Tax=Kutzneria viridogrisea TaxID=47990 RepID=A0ABR6BUA1_9PSEU|nr:hypothetical protein [Kutzneria albida]MBA8930201.1 hypothetical protein [Kutzneria viridogrisea]
MQAFEQARAVVVGFLVEVGGGVQVFARGLHDASALAEDLAGDLQATTEGLADHTAEPGPVPGGVGEQVLTR